MSNAAGVIKLMSPPIAEGPSKSGMNSNCAASGPESVTVSGTANTSLSLPKTIDPVNRSPSKTNPSDTKSSGGVSKSAGSSKAGSPSTVIVISWVVRFTPSESSTVNS